MVLHALLGLVAASALALLALRFRALTPSGAACASVIGALVFAAGGLAWAFLMMLFFLTGSALSRLPGGAEREVADKGSRRDGAQVVANGGVAAAVGLLHLVHPSTVLATAFAGSLSAASADTWATELGTRFGGSPRLITTGQRVPPGTSGGVTRLGIVASLLGATLIAGGSAVSLGPPTASPALIGGFLGALIDTLMGATLQDRRYCPVCATRTEQRVHAPCGTTTESIGGVPWIDNDVVNLTATATGALVAALLSAAT